MRLPILLALALNLSVGLADATERSASAKSEFKRDNPCNNDVHFTLGTKGGITP